MVPKGWEKHFIGQLCLSIVPGRNKPRIFTGNIPWVTIPEIKGRYIPSYLQKNYVCKSEIKAVGAKIVPEGGVIIAAVGDLGLTAIASEPVVLNQQLHAFICKENIYNEYLAYWLETQRPYMESIASKTTIPYMNKANCESIPVLVPPMSEQKKIAKILSTWDKAITTTEKLLANSEQQKKALMQQLLTGKKRFPQFCERWKETHLRLLLKEGKTRNREKSIDRVLSVTNRSGFVLPEEQFSKRVASDDLSNYKIIQKGQFGYNPSRLNVGSFARLDRFNVGILSPMYVVFSVKNKELSDDYFLYWMHSNEAQQRIRNSTQGSVRESVGFDALGSLPFKLPPIIEQNKIASLLTVATQETEILQKKLVCLKQEKKALMQQLLTGKRRVQV